MCTRFVKLAVALVTAIGAYLVLYPRAALADPSGPSCSDPNDTCEVEVELPGSGGGTGADPGDEGGGAPGGGGDGGGDTDALTHCTSDIVDTEADSHPLAGPRPEDGVYLLVMETCTTESGTTVQSAEWLEQGAEGQVQINPEILAQRAVDRLRLPQPGIEASPEATQLVHLPTWLWVTESSWAQQSASASVPGLTVTARATPVEARWATGDGDTVTCTGPGTPWQAGADPKTASPDCGHTYTRPSDDEVEAQVTVTWRITWSGGGVSGTAPDMTTTATTTWPVLESQTVLQ